MILYILALKGSLSPLGIIYVLNSVLTGVRGELGIFLIEVKSYDLYYILYYNEIYYLEIKYYTNKRPIISC